jgi:multidrug efflux pump subunit AcrA (membrane-fusion protein)
VEIAAANVKALQQGGGGGGVVTTVAAPVDGIVADLAAAAGDAVQAGQQVLALGGGQKLAVVVPLQQSELSLVALGAPVEIAVSGRIVNGKVTAIYPEVRGNAVPYFQAHIGVIDPPAGVLEQGMPVVVRIDTGT